MNRIDAFHKFVPISLVVAAAVLATPAAAHKTGEAHIHDFAVNGDGCPLGSTAYLLSDDKTTLQILFSSFIAELAPTGWTVSNPSTTACTVSLKMFVPPGISLTWYRTEHRGFVDTSGGATGQLWTRYYLPGEGGFDSVSKFDFPPGKVGLYTQVHDNSEAAWTKCGGEQLMSINSRVRLAGKATGYNTITKDDETNRSITVLRFKFKSCF